MSNNENSTTPPTVNDPTQGADKTTSNPADQKRDADEKLRQQQAEQNKPGQPGADQKRQQDPKNPGQQQR